ncbi:hypothetical protein QJS04_geneDACA002906 [Acorus gramineus]|uniref:ArsA/GET3 Anion-transporting ATPase-like domain-containing protein n=1 Tax=Acorus gramineus TaxID=55184 RepID=A0AAV9BV07_ACOGR|nr:hypothetical protein QJS04_geneDACA002906 [Acorus gramineus]
MASPALSSSFTTPTPLRRNPNPLQWQKRLLRRRNIAPSMASSDGPSPKPAKLVTFLGKGGSGKTTAAAIAAHYYAKSGLKTCLVVHSQDPTVECLMGCKFGSSPTQCSVNLSVVRLETTKLILEPLERIKRADSRLNLTQGILEGVVGEELGVLPGMDSIFSALAIEKWVRFLGSERSDSQREFDIIVYDGISTEETLRVLGAASRARWYLRYIREMADKTDIGRLTAPLILKLGYESIRLNGASGDGKSSMEIWDDVERLLEKVSAAFTEPSRFNCYILMDPNNKLSVRSALRYWGCAIQAGTQVSGAFGFAPQSSFVSAEVTEKLSPLAFALVPYLSSYSSVDWDATIGSLANDAEEILNAKSKNFQPSVRFDPSKKSVTLLMPGFDKSEIKLYQVCPI